MAATSRKRCREADVQSEGGRRRCKHTHDPELNNDPAFEGNWDSLDDFLFNVSIYKWLQGVEATLPIPTPKTTGRRAEGEDRRRHIMDFRNDVGQHGPYAGGSRTQDLWDIKGEKAAEDSTYSMEDVAEALPRRPGSPQKRRLSLTLKSEPSRSSSDFASTGRKLAEVSSRRTTVTSRTSSPEKQSIDGRTRSFGLEKQSSRSKSRNASPEKQSVGARGIGQGAATMAFRRSEMAECEPSFIFGHQHRLASGIIPAHVAVLNNRISPERLLQGCLDKSAKETIEASYPEEFFPDSLFIDTPRYHENLLEHVKYQCIFGNRNFSTDADESTWSRYVQRVLDGVPKSRIEYDKQLIISGIENRQLLKSVTPIGAPVLRSDLLIEGNPYYPSPFANTCRKKVFPPSEIDKTLSPAAHRTSQLNPAFCVVEVKAEGGDFQEAQTQAAVVGASILLKARQIGANEDVVPCVPAIITIGHLWHLNLIYEEENGIIIAGPWIIGDTLTFLGTLKVVLFVEELRNYAVDTWWPKFVDGSCRDILERQLREVNLSD